MEIKFKMNVFLIFFCATLILLYNVDKYGISYGMTLREKVKLRMEEHYQIPEDPEQRIIFNHFVNQACKTITGEDIKTGDLSAVVAKPEHLFIALQQALNLDFDLKKSVLYEHLNKNVFFMSQAAQIVSEDELITSSEDILTLLSEQLKELFTEAKKVNSALGVRLESCFKDVIKIITERTLVLNCMESSKFITKKKLDILRKSNLKEADEAEAVNSVEYRVELVGKCSLWSMALNNKLKLAIEKAQKLSLSFDAFVQFEIAKVLLKTYMWFYLKSLITFWNCDSSVDGILLLGPNKEELYRFDIKEKTAGSFVLKKEPNPYLNPPPSSGIIPFLLRKALLLLYPLTYIKNKIFGPPESSEDDTELIEVDAAMIFEIILNDVKLLAKVLNQPDFPQTQTASPALEKLKQEELQKQHFGLYQLLKSVFVEEEEEETRIYDEPEQEEDVEPELSVVEVHKGSIDSVLRRLSATVESLFAKIDLPSGIKESVSKFVQFSESAHFSYFESFILVDHLEDQVDLFQQLGFDAELFLEAVSQIDKENVVRPIVKFLSLYGIKHPFSMKALKKEKKSLVLDVMTRLAAFNLLIDIEEGKSRQRPLLKALTVPYWKRELEGVGGILNRYLTLSFLHRLDLVLAMLFVEHFSKLFILYIKLLEERQSGSAPKGSKKERKDGNNVLRLLQHFFKPGYMNTYKDREKILTKLPPFLEKNGLTLPLIALNLPEAAGQRIESLDYLVFGMLPQERAPPKYMTRKCGFKENNQVTEVSVNTQHEGSFVPKRDIKIKKSDFPLLVFLKALIQIYNDEITTKQIKTIFTNTRVLEDLEIIVADIFVSEFEDPAASKGKSVKKKAK